MYTNIRISNTCGGLEKMCAGIHVENVILLATGISSVTGKIDLTLLDLLARVDPEVLQARASTILDFSFVNYRSRLSV